MTVPRVTLVQQAYQALRADIMAGRLPPGTKLVVRILTERLGLSATPIKGALSALEREGFVTAIPHRGFFVAQIGPADMTEIYELRQVIDGIAARKTARAATHNQTADRLDELLDRQRRAAARRDFALYADLDLTFHRTIWDHAGNTRLHQVAENLLAQVRFGAGSSSQLPGRLPTALTEHAAITTAIRAGNTRHAEAEARRHVRSAAHAFDRYHRQD